MRISVPPGRAGRLWLRRRLATAEHGLDLLDRKLRLLRQEQDRLAAVAAQTGERWAETMAEAEIWTFRVATLGGERALRLGASAGQIHVEIDYADVMGTTYPCSVACHFPAAPEQPALTAALTPARSACQRALEAGTRHAVALRAVRIVEAEVLWTRRRIRALRERWIPGLESALAERELALEEQERADCARVRRATRDGSLHYR